MLALKSHPLHPLVWLFMSALSLLAACTPTVESHSKAVPLAEISYPQARPVRTIYPEQLAGYIPNPGMGWQDTQRRNKRFVETVAYKRFNWNILNPAEGTFDWSLIEKLRTDTLLAGSDFSFRIRTAQPPPWGEGQTMPDWLVKQGAFITDGHSEVNGVRSTEPLYSDCLFLEAHGQFIEALRQRYDGDPAVAFIDIGSYGTYGEWDSEQYDEEPGSLDWHARRRIIDMYIGSQGMRPCLNADKQIEHVPYSYTGFQHTQLVMPYTPLFADSLRYALNRREDIGIRHDALGSAKHQQRYSREIGTWVEERWPHAPIIFELTSKADTPESLRRARDFAQEMHASFIHDNLTGRGSDKLLEDLLAVVGYRFVLRAITYTSEVSPGETLSVDMTWRNTGAAPLYRETYPLVLSLTDAQGQPVLEQQLEPNLQDWLPGKTISLPAKLSLPATFPAGQYDLRLAFVDPATRQSVLALAIAGRDEAGRYLIGPVNVVH
ncbi:MAG: DUF4832 domain-containing protein [Anaerolineales bacterium]|nr:DUF4832 domain-containing protein [Anaerolineales bacterium]